MSKNAKVCYTYPEWVTISMTKTVKHVCLEGNVLIEMNRNKKLLHKVTANVLGITLASAMAAGGVQIAAPVSVYAAQETVSLTNIYLDGTAAKGDGSSKESPVNSFGSAVSLAGQNSIIYVCGTVTISSEQTLSLPSGVQLKRADGFQGAIFKVTGDGKLTVSGNWISASDIDTSSAKLGSGAFVSGTQEKTDEDKETEDKKDQPGSSQEESKSEETQTAGTEEKTEEQTEQQPEKTEEPAPSEGEKPADEDDIQETEKDSEGQEETVPAEGTGQAESEGESGTENGEQNTGEQTDSGNDGNKQENTDTKTDTEEENPDNTETDTKSEEEAGDAAGEEDTITSGEDQKKEDPTGSSDEKEESTEDKASQETGDKEVTKPEGGSKEDTEAENGSETEKDNAQTDKILKVRKKPYRQKARDRQNLKGSPGQKMESKIPGSRQIPAMMGTSRKIQIRKRIPKRRIRIIQKQIRNLKKKQEMPQEKRIQ